MQIKEYEDEYSIRIEFYIHRAVHKTKHIIKAMFNRNENAIFNHKLKIVEELDESDFQLKGRKKEIIREWSKVDPRFEEIYKDLYPRGGSRKNAGRPQGSKTNKTERLNQTISKEEKELLSEVLNNCRKAEEKSQEEIKAALAPIFRRIDESFGDDEAGREKWRKKVGNINPMFFPQLLEYIVLFGIDKLLPKEKEVENLYLPNDPYIRVMSQEQKPAEKSTKKETK